MKEGRYVEALRPLRRAFDDNGENRDAGLLLMECHYNLQEYQEAMDVGTLLDMSVARSPQEARLFADVRIANDDFSEAYLGLIDYLAEGDNDGSIYFWLDKASYLLSWDTLGSKSAIDEVSGINSIYNEYAPFLMEDELWFVTDQVTVQVIFPTAFSNQSLHLLYRTVPSSSGLSLSRPKMLMRNREYYYHDGPVSYHPKSDRYALSLREIEGLQSELKTGIYFSDLSGSEDALEAFKYNGGYNTGHPTFSKEDSRMYFASDRPGGYGQMDIWYTDWINGEWTVPVNLGPKVNTPGNEVFPFHIKGRLFYSSDRRDKGYGGLDIYYVSLLNDDLAPYNLRAPINSPYDDFSVAMRDDFTGYLSSNRRSGLGGDDIFAMEFVPQQEKLDSIRFAIEGATNAPISMRIFDSKGVEVKGVEVDRFGMATVSELYTREVYTVKTEGLFDGPGVLVVYNAQGQPVRKFDGENDSFQVELLDHMKYAMEPEENVDNSELFDLFGEVKTEEEVTFDSVSVILQDFEGKDLSEVATDQDGKFEFKGLQLGLDYGLVTRGLEVEHGIDILGRTGAPTQSLDETYANTFAFTRTIPEATWMMDAEIAVPVVFAMVPTVEFENNRQVELYAYQDSLIRECSTDEDGFIDMGSLIAGHAYEVKFPGAGFDRTDRLVILGGSGDTTQTVRPRGHDSYVFEYMIYGEVEDPSEEGLVKDSDLRLYRGELENRPARQGTAFMVMAEGYDWKDTVSISPEGAFIMQLPVQYANYKLRPIGPEIDMSKLALSVYDVNGNMILDAYTNHPGFITFSLLDEPYFALGRDKNMDDSVLHDYSGKIDNWNESKDTEFVLTTDDGVPVDTIVATPNGLFTIYGVKSGRYKLVGKEAGIDLSEKELTLSVLSGEAAIAVLSEDGKTYAFELLNDKDYALEKQANSDGASMYEYTAKLGNTKREGPAEMVLFSEKGVPLDTLNFSNEENLRLGFLRAGKYRLKVTLGGGDISNSILSVYNQNGEEVVLAEAVDGQNYVFELLEDEDYALNKQANPDVSAAMDYNGRIEIQKDAGGARFALLSDDGAVIDTIKLSDSGQFEVKKLVAGKYMLMSLDGRTDLKGKDLILSSESQEMVISVASEDGKSYRFELLENAEYVLEKQSNADGSSLFEFKGRIGSEGSGKPIPFVLYSAKGVPLDSLAFSLGESFNLGYLRPGKYRLRTADDQAELEGSEFKLTRGAENEVLSAKSNDGKSFEFEILRDADYALQEQMNPDYSVLLANLKGKTDIDEKGRVVKIFDHTDKFLAEAYTLEGGEFAFREIPMDSVYIIRAEGATKVEARSDRMGFKVKGKRNGDAFTLDFTDAGGQERIIAIPDVYYAFNSYALNAKSKLALDDLVQMLKANPAMRIRILSHTDSRGPASYNLTLSKRRAQEVVKYLVNRGISAQRLESEGRGERDLINRCKDGVRCSNAEHAENRRTEFAIID